MYVSRWRLTLLCGRNQRNTAKQFASDEKNKFKTITKGEGMEADGGIQGMWAKE